MSKEKQTYNPCDDCQYSYSKNNQESGMCKICEFPYFRDRKQSEGEWVLEHETYGKMICSNCKEEAPTKTVVDRDCTWHILYDEKPFCPNCGARMKGGE